MNDSATPPAEIDLTHVLLGQTARIGWSELARHFARGRLLVVAAGEDLTAIAKSMIRDDAGELERRSGKGTIRRAHDEDAMAWNARDAEFWAVVVAPWVLVQEIAADN